MSFPTTIFATASSQGHTSDTAAQKFPFGQLLEYEDGRKFRYGLIGATALVVGNIVQGKATVAGDVDLVFQTAAAIGATSVSITAQGTSVANYYADGWMVINKAPSAGFIHKVKSHPVFAVATKVITLYPDYPIRGATTTTSEVAFTPSAYKGIIVAPTTLTNRFSGVACTAVTAAQYGFVQTGGVAGVSAAVSLVTGNNVSATLAAAGRAGVSTATLLPWIGYVLTIATTADEIATVHLTLD